MRPGFSNLLSNTVLTSLDNVASLRSFSRLFDETFSVEGVQKAGGSVRAEGSENNFVLDDRSDMTKITRGNRHGNSEYVR